MLPRLPQLGEAPAAFANPTPANAPAIIERPQECQESIVPTACEAKGRQYGVARHDTSLHPLQGPPDGQEGRLASQGCRTFRHSLGGRVDRHHFPRPLTGGSFSYQPVGQQATQSSDLNLQVRARLPSQQPLRLRQVVLLLVLIPRYEYGLKPPMPGLDSLQRGHVGVCQVFFISYVEP